MVNSIKRHLNNRPYINIKKLLGDTQNRFDSLSGRLESYRFNNLLKFDTVFHFNCDNKPLSDKSRIDIITVAFNNDRVIAQQIRLLSKYILDPYYYTVIDN